MKLRTDHKNIILAFAFLCAPSVGHASISVQNVAEYAIIRDGYNKLDNLTARQRNSLLGTAALESGIGWEFEEMKGWERKYNSYLKKAQGYAESLAAASTLVADGVDIIRRLFEFKNVVESHPVGVFSTTAMNDLYLEVATQFIKTYRLVKYSISQDGQKNMQTGAQKRELLWLITDEMELLNTKLKDLTYCVAFYNLTDVWNRYTAGMTGIDRGSIARNALDRWHRVNETLMIYHKAKVNW